jgi:hypothetical protein
MIAISRLPFFANPMKMLTITMCPPSVLRTSKLPRPGLNPWHGPFLGATLGATFDPGSCNIL